MKKINFIKMALDIIMAVVFALLFNKMVLGGIVFHEVAGTAIGAAFILHIGLNWRWVKQVSLKIFSSKMSIKTRIGYVVDILLLITMLITIISGIAISKVLFTNLNLGNMMFFKIAHTSVPYIALILLGIHIGLHWVWAMNTFKKMFKISSGKNSLGYVAKVLAVFVLVFGIYSIYTTNFFSRVSSVTRVFSTSQMPAGEMRGEKMANGIEGRPAGAPDGNFKKGQAPNDTNNGQRPEGLEGKGDFKAGGMDFNANPFNVVTSYLRITAVFAVATYYLEKLLMLKKSKGKIMLATS